MLAIYKCNCFVYCRKLVTSSSLLLLFGTLILYKINFNFTNFSITVDTHFSGNQVNQSQDIVCNNPNLDPFDPSIMKFVKHPKPIVCKNVQPYLTILDDDGYLRYNETELEIIKKSNKTFVCKYSTFDGKPGNSDKIIQFDKEITLTESIKLSKDSVFVTCNYDGHNPKLFYANVHAHPYIADDRIFAEPTENQLSVLIFLIDSTSHSALQRNLPLTYNYTKNIMGMKFFTMLNKVGSNSFPNQMAYLTGKRVVDEQDDMMKEIPGDYSKTPLNSWPFIWKYFAAKSYTTTINEDWSKYGLFTYGLKGFTKKMVDYYYHSFWIKVERNRYFNSSRYCYLNEVRAKLSIDITRRHIVALKNKLQFVYSIITDSAHEFDNEVEQLDPYVMNFWKQLFEGNYFNKTIIIFASDHGLRVGDIRKTFVGTLEQSLPFYGVWFPQWFYRLHPSISRNIGNNLHLLTTSFDVYETLKDIADGNFDGFQRNASSRGQSQLYPLPLNRNCKQAGIPVRFCSCMHATSLNSNDTIWLEAASFVVDSLNLLLQNSSNKCQKINLTKVNYVRQINFNQEMKGKIQSTKSSSTFKGISNEIMVVDTYIIGVETDPFNATFEAVVKFNRNIKEKRWTLDGEIARTSLYAGLSDCISNKFLKQYCPCIKVMQLHAKSSVDAIVFT